MVVYRVCLCFDDPAARSGAGLRCFGGRFQRNTRQDSRTGVQGCLAHFPLRLREAFAVAAVARKRLELRGLDGVALGGDEGDW